MVDPDGASGAAVTVRRKVNWILQLDQGSLQETSRLPEDSGIDKEHVKGDALEERYGSRSEKERNKSGSDDERTEPFAEDKRVGEELPAENWL